MSLGASAVQAEGNHVHANGIDIHYVEAGEGQPLILLHGGVVSTNLIWEGVPIAYASHMGALANHFRVIAPDTRGGGRTAHSGSEEVSFDLLADDVVALVDALGLERPLITGFSEGAITATIVAIRSPEAVRAVVNHAGYDFFNPNAASYAMCRMMLGGSPDATEADPDAAAGFFAQSDEMRAVFELMKADQDGGQGPGHWKTYLELAFPTDLAVPRLHVRGSPQDLQPDVDPDRRPRQLLLGRGGRHGLPNAPGRRTRDPAEHRASDNPGGDRDHDRVLRATAREPVRLDARGRLKRKACRSCRRSASRFRARWRPSASCEPHTTSPSGEPRSGPPCPSRASPFTTAATLGPTSPKAPAPVRSSTGNAAATTGHNQDS